LIVHLPFDKSLFEGKKKKNHLFSEHFSVSSSQKG
jgi:hypothetical protein